MTRRSSTIINLLFWRMGLQHQRQFRQAESRTYGCSTTQRRSNRALPVRCRSSARPEGLFFVGMHVGRLKNTLEAQSQSILVLVKTHRCRSCKMQPNRRYGRFAEHRQQDQTHTLRSLFSAPFSNFSMISFACESTVCQCLIGVFFFNLHPAYFVDRLGKWNPLADRLFFACLV